MAASGPRVVRLIREFIQVRMTQRRGSAARVFRRSPVVETAGENERRNVAPNWFLLRGICKTRLPNRAVVQLLAAEGRVRKGVRRIARRAKCGPIYVVAVHEMNQYLLVARRADGCVTRQHFRGARAVAAPKLIHQQREAGEPPRAA